MAAYKIVKTPFGSPGVLRIADGAFVPADLANGDWRTYQTWLAAGNTPDAADPPSQFVNMDGQTWLDRFSGAEQIALFTLARTNVQVDIFLHQLAQAKDFVLRDAAGQVPARLQAGLDRLVTAGVLTAQRRTDILAAP